MKKRVILILSDGMRRDSLPACGNAYVEKFSAESAVWCNATTIMPSITLPCHMSLMHSVPSERHGITSNDFSPMARPVDGLFEQLKNNKKRAAIFYAWGQLKDIYRGSSPAVSYCLSGRWRSDTTRIEDVLTQSAIGLMESSVDDVDFIFLYLPGPDTAGHAKGWMGEEYIEEVYHTWDCVKRVVSAATEQDTVIVTADHGGHARDHGENIPEDMEIPIIMRGPDFQPGIRTEPANIMDIAPTICKILGIPANEDWEGKSLL